MAVLSEPLWLAGAHITHVSLHNLDFILEHEVHIGAKIGVVRSGEVIPYMTRMVEPYFDPETSLNPFWTEEAMHHTNGVETPKRFREAMGMVRLASIKFPEDCPECRGATQVRDAYAYCENRECPGNRRGRILKWIRELDIKNVGEGLVTELVKLGKIKSPADLYQLTSEDVEAVERKGAKHFEKMMKSLRSKMEPTLVEFMAALGIPNAGKKVWSHIQATGVDTIQKIEQLTPETIAQAERMGEKRAQEIHQELQFSFEEINRLIHAGICIKRPVEGGKLSGKSFCITGSLSVEIDGKKATKKALGVLLEQHGARMEPGVTKNLDYLILADPSSTSSKAQKARKYGTQLISPQQALDMLV